MSADNYYLIRADGEKFVVSCEFASDSQPGPIGSRHRRFDEFMEAFRYASEEYSEYGARVAKSAEALEEKKRKG